MARMCLAVSIEECGLVPVDNDQYFGYMGGRWYVVIILLERQGMVRPNHGWRTWIRRHPFEVQRLMAEHLTMILDSEAHEWDGLRVWQHGHDWEGNGAIRTETDHYISKVQMIQQYLAQAGIKN